MTPNLKAFLNLIAHSEGTSTHPLTQNNGYDVIVSGLDGKHVFSDYSFHPFEHGRLPIRWGHGPNDLSTASGRYQIKLSTWKEVRDHLNLPDFSPASQDFAAAELVRRRHAIDVVEARDIAQAIQLCSLEWASFPGNHYGQGGKTLTSLLNKYAELTAPTAEGQAG